MDAIVVKNLSKTFRVKVKESGLKGSVKSLFKPTYKEIKAVDNISFTIKQGELVGFIGPNGAGKSTTLKMLTGILFPDDKKNTVATVLGITPWKERKKLAYRIGTVFGQRSQLWMHLPPRDSFELFTAIYDLDKNEAKRRLDKLCKTFEIDDLLDTPVRKLSLGQRMRCELVAALLHKPEVIYLDEPSIGLDIIAKKKLREHILKVNREEGITIILTSHDMDDIEEVCERVIIINHGKIVHDSAFAELRKDFLRKKMITVYKKKPAKRLSFEGVKIINETKEETKIEVDIARSNIKEVLVKISSHYDIDDIEITDPPIEEIIEEIYKRKN